MSNDVVKKATRSRRADGVKSVNKNGQVIESVYCRKCCETKRPSEFYSAVDNFLDSNGYFSLCKSCIGKMYVNFYKSEGHLEKAFYKLCKNINLKYDIAAIDALRSQYNAKGKEFGDESDVGTYKARLVSVQKSFGEKSENLDLTFKENIITSQNVELLQSDDFEEAKELIEFWGQYPTEDIQFLEKELSEWKANYSCSNRAELMVLKEICYIELEKKKLRKAGGDSDTKDLVKRTNELLKVGGIQPYQTKAVEGSKSVDTLGMWIADVENFEPAQWLEGEGHEIYHDVANTEKYFQDYFVRPLRNFLLQTKDFNIDDDNFEELSDGFDTDEIDEKEEIEKE